LRLPSDSAPPPACSHTSSISYEDSGNPSLDVELNPTVFDWGFALQYSLPHMNANVSELGGPDFLKHLMFVAEFAFQTPVSNYAPGGRVTTGTVQPGAIYLADTWQFAVEALIPINGASGHNVGAVAELHFFLRRHFPQFSRQAAVPVRFPMSRTRTIRNVAALGFAFIASPAFAHAQLQKAVPAVGGTVTASPTEIRLKFSEGVEPRFSSIALATEEGAAIPLGKPNIDPADIRTFIAAVPQALKAGVYTVTWRAVSVDTHKTQGSFSFTVAP
jgi:methionine-rich copper-binding protein CopC